MQQGKTASRPLFIPLACCVELIFCGNVAAEHSITHSVGCAYKVMHWDPQVTQQRPCHDVSRSLRRQDLLHQNSKTSAPYLNKLACELAYFQQIKYSVCRRAMVPCAKWTATSTTFNHSLPMRSILRRGWQWFAAGVRQWEWAAGRRGAPGQQMVHQQVSLCPRWQEMDCWRPDCYLITPEPHT